MAIVFQTFNRADSTHLIHVTKAPNLADLWVYPVNYLGGHRGDCIWYFTDNRAEASSRIYLCSQAEAQAKVYFVNRYADAGWQKNQKLGSFNPIDDFAGQFRDATNAPEKTRSYGDIAKEMLGMGGSEADNSPSSLQQSITNLTDNHQQMMQSPQGSTSGQAAQRPPVGNDQQIGNIQDALNDFAGQFRDTANAPEKTRSYGDIARGMLGVGGSKADNSPSSLQQSITNVTDKHQQMMQSQQRSPASQNRGKIADAVKKSGNPSDP